MALKKAVFKFLDNVTDSYRIVELDLDEDTTEAATVEIFQKLKAPLPESGSGSSALSGAIVKTIKPTGGDFNSVTTAVAWVKENAFTEGATVDFNIDSGMDLPEAAIINLGSTDFSFVSFNALGPVTSTTTGFVVFYRGTRSPRFSGIWNTMLGFVLVDNVDTTKYTSDPYVFGNTPAITSTRLSVVIAINCDNVNIRDTGQVQLQSVNTAFFIDVDSILASVVGKIFSSFTRNPTSIGSSIASPYISGSGLSSVVITSASGVEDLEFNTVISGLDGDLMMILNSWLKVGTSDIFSVASPNAHIIVTPPKNSPDAYHHGPVITNDYIKAATISTMSGKLLGNISVLNNNIPNSVFARDLSSITKASVGHSVTEDTIFKEFANNILINIPGTTIELDIIHDFVSLRLTNNGSLAVTVTFKKRGVLIGQTILIQPNQWVDVNNQLMEIDRLAISDTVSNTFIEVPVGFPNVEIPGILTNGTLFDERNFVNANIPTVDNTFFLDSTTGSDSNNGLTPTTPFQTLAALSTITLGGNGVARYYLAGTFDITTANGPHFPGVPVLSGWKSGATIVGHETTNTVPTDNLDGTFSYAISSINVDTVRSIDSYKEYTFVNDGMPNVAGEYTIDLGNLVVFPYVGDSTVSGSFLVNTKLIPGVDSFYLDGRNLLTIDANIDISFAYKTILGNGITNIFADINGGLVTVLKCPVLGGIDIPGGAKVLFNASPSTTVYGYLHDGIQRCFIRNKGILISSGNNLTLAGASASILSNIYTPVGVYDGSVVSYLLADTYTSSAAFAVYSEGNVFIQNCSISGTSVSSISMESGNTAIKCFSNSSSNLSLPVDGTELPFY